MKQCSESVECEAPPMHLGRATAVACCSDMPRNSPLHEQGRIPRAQQRPGRSGGRRLLAELVAAGAAAARDRPGSPRRLSSSESLLPWQALPRGGGGWPVEGSLPSVPAEPIDVVLRSPLAGRDFEHEGHAQEQLLSLLIPQNLWGRGRCTQVGHTHPLEPLACQGISPAC